jgi:hypothetical protein
MPLASGDVQLYAALDISSPPLVQAGRITRQRVSYTQHRTDARDAFLAKELGMPRRCPGLLNPLRLTFGPGPGRPRG